MGNLSSTKRYSLGFRYEHARCTTCPLVGELAALGKKDISRNHQIVILVTPVTSRYWTALRQVSRRKTNPHSCTPVGLLP